MVTGVGKEIWMHSSKKTKNSGTACYLSSRFLMLDYSANRFYVCLSDLSNAIKTIR
jgi:hypothetical protein